jgi:sulfur dioxygenase
MKIICKQLNPHSCKTYLIKIENSNEIILIDPVLDHFNDYKKLIIENNYKLIYVIDTHTHADHISSCAALKDFFHCDYIMHELAPAKCVTIRVKDEDKFCFFNQIDVTIISTPGHTKDSISLIFPEFIITGDVLFLDDGGAGRDDLPGGDPNFHWESLQKIKMLPDSLMVYPAHDYRNRISSNLKKQKQTNPHLQKDSKEEFVDYINDLKLGPADWMKDVLKANYACAADPKAAWIPIDSPACEVKGTVDVGLNDILVDDVSVSQLKQKILNKIPLILLDVRDKEELSGPLGQIENVINISITDLVKQIATLEKYKQIEIVTICRSGARALTAAQILKKSGFEKVYVLSGGMSSWISSLN